jgi:hypothetical protein
MNADSFYVIGTTHAVCQDYALSGVTEDMAYAVVCDGCSSAPDTDWGARLLAKSTELSLRRTGGVIGESVFKAADLHRHGLELHPNSLLATLGWVALTKANGFGGCLYGDGNIIARHRNTGKLRVMEVEFTSGGPYYLKYGFTPGDPEEYLKKLGWGKYVITTTDETVEVKEAPVENGMFGLAFNFPTSEYDMVAIITDGLSHFSKKVVSATSITKDSVKIGPILQEVMAFKGYAGTFVRRRCHKAFEKFKMDGYLNEDDFGIGVVYDGKEN